MRPLFAQVFAFLLVVVGPALCFAAEGPDLVVVIGSVVKGEKDSLSMITSDKRKLDFKVTGTSNIRILAPQKRADKIVVTQRNADAADLMPGQPIAVIYTVADGDKVILSAVAKPVSKDK